MSIITSAKAFTKKLFTLVKRDLLIESSYSFTFIAGCLLILLKLIIFFYLSKLLGGRSIPSLAKYSGDYFQFVFIGIVISTYLKIASLSFAKNLKTEQIIGTLTSVFITPTQPYTIISL